MSNTTRSQGYYWVKGLPNDGWETAYWDGKKYWQIIGHEDMEIKDNEFYAINESKLEPPNAT